MNFCNLRPRSKWTYLIFAVILIFLVDHFGLLTHLSESKFEEEFQYPYMGDVKLYSGQIRKGLKPDVPPINIYNYSFLSTANQRCTKDHRLRLIILVKSAAANFDRRQAIRNSWGFERRFSDVNIKTVFFVGMVKDADILMAILRERETFNDVAHIDFEDSYYNNTAKTVSSFRWAIEYCPHANFYFFSDDDMYVSTKNILRFLRNPSEYPSYLTDTKGKYSKIDPYHLELASDVVLFAGYVFLSSPLRHKSSKWYVTLEEYPYDKWPPYATAGAYVLSLEALYQLYYASMYTKHFRFDDIFLGLVALKAGVEIFNCNEIYFYHKPYNVDSYRYVIASHGFDKPNTLLKIWNEQKTAGNA